jgi:hypothetical protein
MMKAKVTLPKSGDFQLMPTKQSSREIDEAEREFIKVAQKFILDAIGSIKNG